LEDGFSDGLAIKMQEFFVWGIGAESQYETVEPFGSLK